MDYFPSLKKYTELPGPMGHEHRVQEEFMKDLKPYADEIRKTNVGNVIAHIPGEGRRVVVFGHADEIAFYTLSITEDGFLHISRGRADKLSFPYILVGQKALVLGDGGDVRGAFVSATGHVLTPTEREKPLEPWSVVVDIGATSKAEVEEMGIHVGSPIIWNPETERLGNKVLGKAMDDRFTHPVIIELAKRVQGEKLGCDLYLASSVQEEIGLRGAQELSRHGFDVSLALDIGIAGDYPPLPKDRMPIRLGDGPVIAYRDAAIVYNIDVIKELRDAAERNRVPYQHGIFEHYGSDSVAMIAGGAKPNLLCVPCRYSHSPIEMIHLDDMENLVRLLHAYVTQ
ncbi:M42 family peptidase [Candidatus Bathyarchaeota archaeon]|nr:M42 family peptidase [Candidatus Bathyarchaeota archaeon]